MTHARRLPPRCLVRPILMAAMGLFLGAVTVFSGGPAKAEFSGRSVADVVQVSFLPGWRLDNGTHMAGLRIVLAPGWKTYWRAPGEGGVPTVVTLTKADAVTGLSIHWPRPQVFVVNGMRSIGYRDAVVLPVEFALSQSGEIAIAGEIDMGVCLDICIPITMTLTGVLPTATAPVAEIRQALARRPLTAAEAGIGPARCAVEPISDGLRVQVTLAMPPMGAEETLVVEHAQPGLWVSETTTRRSGDTLHGTADVVPPHRRPFALNRSDLRITVIGTDTAVELEGCTG